MRRPALSLCVLLVVTSCAPDLRDDYPFDGQSTDGPLVRTEAMEGGVTLMRVDATSKNALVYVDLDEGRELKVDEAFETNGWDLAFKRFEIQMNGGASNPAGAVEVAVLTGVDFDALTVAPSTGYVKDGADPVFNGVEGGWYYYDLGVHRLLTRGELTYVVRTGGGSYFKLKMLSYYDDAGTPAALSLKYAALAPPTASVP